MPSIMKKRPERASEGHRIPRAHAGSAAALDAPVCARTVTMLAVSPLEEDHLFLRHIFDHCHWDLHSTRSCAEALAFLEARFAPVVVCERDLPDGNWRQVREAVERMGRPSLLIVTSRLADDNLWAEVLNLGGYDVLMKPFDPTEVVRVISLAWLHWRTIGDGAGAPAAATGT